MVFLGFTLNASAQNKVLSTGFTTLGIVWNIWYCRKILNVVIFYYISNPKAKLV